MAINVGWYHIDTVVPRSTSCATRLYVCTFLAFMLERVDTHREIIGG